ncbi:hypothetical protein NPM06_20095 [Bacillus cereus]|uniref:hypothetical protein n=1 Tax=Bacillus cereus group TaxID=86661 RepID=UPI00211320D8|nr:hypothetical protein [Bacillus cereus]
MFCYRFSLFMGYVKEVGKYVRAILLMTFISLTIMFPDMLDVAKTLLTPISFE